MNDAETLLANLISLGTKEVWQNCIQAVDGALHSWFEKHRKAKIRRIYLVGCGTSLYAGHVGKYVLERLTHVPVEVRQAFSLVEFPEPTLLTTDVLVVGISTTGSSTATCNALDLARRSGALTLAFTAAADSEITRIAETSILTGGRVSVAVQTETYLQSLICLYLLGVHLAEHLRQLSGDDRRYWLDQIEHSEVITRTFLDQQQSSITDLVAQHVSAEMLVILGTGPNYGTAGEASLKVIEMAKMASIFQEMEEFFHGYDRQLNASTPVVFIAPPERRAAERMVDFLTFTKSAGIPSIVLESGANPLYQKIAVRTIALRGEIDPLATPLIFIAPCYLFSYFLAVKHGVDPSARRFPGELALKTHYHPIPTH
jgi:glucosamine--fructose-6-phosphate aminotransferase (isomerizing)